MGTSQDYRVAAEEGATYVRVGSVALRLNADLTAAGSPHAARYHSRRDGLRRPLEPHARLLRHRRGGRLLGRGRLHDERGARAHVHRRGAERAPAAAPPPRDEYEDWTDSDAAAGAGPRSSAPRARASRHASRRPVRPRRLEAAPSPNVKVHLVLPRSFNDAQQIADKFKDGVPVILNLQSDRPGALQAPDRLRQRPHVRAERRHAARRRQGLPADAAQRRGLRRGARAAPRARRLLQPGLDARGTAVTGLSLSPPSQLRRRCAARR